MMYEEAGRRIAPYDVAFLKLAVQVRVFYTTTVVIPGTYLVPTLYLLRGTPADLHRGAIVTNVPGTDIWSSIHPAK